MPFHERNCHQHSLGLSKRNGKRMKKKVKNQNRWNMCSFNASDLFHSKPFFFLSLFLLLLWQDTESIILLSL